MTLSPGMPAEEKVIASLMVCLKGRRQQWLRKLLTLGMLNKNVIFQEIAQKEPLGNFQKSNKLLSIGLDRRAPEDMAILHEIELLPIVRRSQALRAMLVTGILSLQNENIAKTHGISAPNNFSHALEDEKQKTQHLEKSDTESAEPRKNKVKKQKTGSIKSEKKDFSTELSEKIRDNPSAAAALEKKSAGPNFDAENESSSKKEWVEDVDALHATETVIFDQQENPVVLDLDLSDAIFLEKKKPVDGKEQKLVKMRGLFS